MDGKNDEVYQNSLRNLLNQALAEALKRNEAQTKTWKDYKKAHEKVKKGLEILPQELTTNCMVPIGRKALMKGKLVHTNEILICLGEGYFAKYSAKQAIAVCDRRIKQADEMLISLEKEQNLIEMRQSLPAHYGIFGDEKHQEIIETYNEEEEKEWRIKHRQREKEYREKLAELRMQEKTEIQSEEDLWQRLDELELQEELEDEIDRLHEDDCNYYGEDNDEYYEEEGSDFSEDETTDDMIEERLGKLKNNNISKQQIDFFDKEADHDFSSIYNTETPHQPTSSTSSDIIISENKSSRDIFDNTTSLEQDISDSSSNNSSYISANTSKEGTTDSNSCGTSSQSEVEITRSSRLEPQSRHNREEVLLQTGANKNADDDEDINPETRRRRVSFTDKIKINVFGKWNSHSFEEPLKREIDPTSECDIENEIEKEKIIEDMISVGVDLSSINDGETEDSVVNESQVEEEEKEEEEDDDIIRIKFKHSKRRRKIPVRLPGDRTIEDPSDIYRIFWKPKSILKKSSSDVSYSQSITPPADDVFDQESEELPIGSSYTIIVKDVEERKPEITEVDKSSSKTRPPSRFKMARSGIK